MRSLLQGLKAYLSDWRNWVTHGLVGLGFLALAIWAPVDWRIKIVVIVLVVIFNVFRMRGSSDVEHIEFSEIDELLNDSDDPMTD